MATHTSKALRAPWCKDFSDVPAALRRAGHYALRLIAYRRELHRRLQDDDFLGALWMLTRPLFDPAKLALLELDWVRNDDEAAEDDDGLEYDRPRRRLRFHRVECPLLEGLPGERMREYLIARFTAIPDSLIERLAADDGNTPTHPGIAVLASCAGLDPIETFLMDFVEKKGGVRYFREFLRETGFETQRENVESLSVMGNAPLAEVQARLRRSGPLSRLDLVRRARRGDLEDFLDAGELLNDIIALEPTSREALLTALVEPAQAVDCPLSAFPHLERDAERLRCVIGSAARRRSPGVNALLYGPPGSGKTQFASALAQAAGLQAYQVKAGDDEGDGLSREGRLGAYQLAQRLLSGRDDCLLVFDEVEDVFGNAESALLAILGQRAHTNGEKGWMNRLLEENVLPAIWITNDAESMDPAFLRRFLLPVAFSTPPRSVRRQMVERHLGEAGLPADVLDELAADAALAPAQFGAARRLLEHYDGDAAERFIKEGVSAARRVLHGDAGPRLRKPSTLFDSAYLNLAGEVQPRQLADALARRGFGSMCFFGPPGTGKTAFTHVLAEALDKEVIVKTSADIVSPYVGETERNIARLFAEIDTDHCVLLLDEIDSLLRDRRQARHSWETTQVNELLQQMERFPGVFIAATNLMSELDPAAMRRFDFKLQFRPLNCAQRRALFARETLGDSARASDLPTAIGVRLDAMEMLTPGDFANVARQRDILGTNFTPETFLRRLIVECRYKEAGLHVAA